MADNLKTLLDQQENQLIQPNNAQAVLIPFDILQKCEHVDIAVYMKLVEFAMKGDGDVVTLPPRDEFARLCNTNKDTLRLSLHRLHETGYITILNLNQDGKKTRFQARVKWLRDRAVMLREGLAGEVGGLEETLRNIARKLYESPEITLHNKNLCDTIQQNRQFPPQLHALKSVCVNKDQSGKSLADVSDEVLFQLSGCASFTDVELALRETESFRPKNDKPIRNIFLAFRERFCFDAAGKGTLKGNRKWKYGEVREVRKRDNPPSDSPYKARARELHVSIFPDEFHDEKCVDRYCKMLNDRAACERGELPQSMRQIYIETSDIILPYNVEPDYKVVLSESFELHRIEPGYWRPVRADVKLNVSQQRSRQTNHISATMEKILQQPPSFNS